MDYTNIITMSLVASSRPNTCNTSYSSPLSDRDYVLDRVLPLPSRAEFRRREASFVNDAVRTSTYYYPRRIPIIPKYDAIEDPMCAKYFETPLAQEAVRVCVVGKVSDWGKEEVCGMCARGNECVWDG